MRKLEIGVSAVVLLEISHQNFESIMIVAYSNHHSDHCYGDARRQTVVGLLLNCVLEEQQCSRNTSAT